MLNKQQLTRKLKQVRLLLCDVDGVLTDGSVYFGSSDEYKRFHVFDGLGVKLLRNAGIKTGWISARPSPATARRAAELQIEFLSQDDESKVNAIENILHQTGCAWSNVCYIGDDVADLGALSRAGVAVCVPDAHPQVRKLAHYVTRARGGRGAVREVIELILKAQNKWSDIINHYSQ